MAENDTADATFAFVDLAGFVVLTEICGDRQAARLAGRLTDLARQAARPGVTIVKTIGDAVMLRADTPEPIVTTVLDLADRAADEDGFLALRAGIQHGSAVHRGGDYFGHAVNLAARVTAVASAGQAVVTKQIQDTCTGLGVCAEPLGTRHLRNIATPVKLYAVALTASRYPVDPVCHVRVDPSAAPSRLRHNNRDWWFCSPECAQRFAAAPTHHARA